MKHILILIFALSLLSSCSTSRTAGFSNNKSNEVIKNNPDNDGLSYATAIVIEETTETSGINAEYKWLKEHYPGYSLRKQSLNSEKGSPYDLMYITTASGKELTIYFNIANYFGKW